MDKIDLPESVEEVLYIHADYDGVVSIHTYRGASPDIWGPQIGEHTVTVPVPQLTHAEINNKFVDALVEEKKKLQASTQMQINNIDHKISELLALEDHSESKDD